jgi:hypothetical protein
MDANRGDFLEPKTFCGRNPAMAREYSSGSVNHHGPEKPKTLDTFRELLNLPLAVNPRIPGIKFQVRNGYSSDGGRQTWLYARQSAGGFGYLKRAFRFFFS